MIDNWQLKLGWIGLYLSKYSVTGLARFKIEFYKRYKTPCFNMDYIQYFRFVFAVSRYAFTILIGHEKK